MTEIQIGDPVKIFTPRVLDSDESFETPLDQQRAMERRGVVVAKNKEKRRILVEFPNGKRIGYFETEVALINEPAAPLSLFGDDELPESEKHTYGRNGR